MQAISYAALILAILFLLMLGVTVEEIVYGLRAEKTAGVVREVRVDHYGDSETVILRAEYSANGRSYTNRPDVQVWWMAEPGEKVVVLYDPKNPERWRPGSAVKRCGWHLGVLGVFAGIIVGCAYTVPYLKRSGLLLPDT